LIGITNLVFHHGLHNQNSSCSHHHFFNKALDKTWETKPLPDILEPPSSALQGLTPKDVELFVKVHFKTVRDLGSWKFAGWAEAICVVASFEKLDGSIR